MGGRRPPCRIGDSAGWVGGKPAG